MKQTVETIFSSPVGDLECVFSGGKLVQLNILPAASSKRRALDEMKGHPFMSELSDYFAGRLKKFRQKIEFATGTDFQKKVWAALLTIPYGHVRSYKWVAEAVGSPGACRAVGNAVGKNPLPIIVPCHRVIARDGSIGGFSSGIVVKKALLEIEGVKF